MQRAFLLSVVLLCTVSHLSFAGLIVQPSAGTTIAPGSTAAFDLIIRNETTSNTWSDFVLIGALKFEDPIPLIGGQEAPYFVPTSTRGITPENPPWVLAIKDSLDQWVFGANAAVTLNPGYETKFATMSIFIPADFIGSFQLQLAVTDPPLLQLLSENGQDVTDGWSGDPNPPLPLIPAPPGGGAPTGFSLTVDVTAVPEPGPVAMFGCLGAIVCMLSVRRRRTKE